MGIDTDHCVTLVLKSRLVEFGGVEHDTGNVIRSHELLNQFLAPFVKPWIQKAFKPPELCRIVENDVRHDGPIDRTVRRKNSLSPPFAQLRSNVRIKVLLVNELIRVNHPAAQTGQQVRHRGLAGADTADQSNNRLASITPGMRQILTNGEKRFIYPERKLTPLTTTGQAANGSPRGTKSIDRGRYLGRRWCDGLLLLSHPFMDFPVPKPNPLGTPQASRAKTSEGHVTQRHSGAACDSH